MTLQEIYELSIQMATAADPRGKDLVKKILVTAKKEFDELSPKKKKYFDMESLTNPYSDSRILFGDRKTRVKKIMAGIDADAAEVLLADRLNDKGAKIDAVIGHHPNGVALAGLFGVMDLQVDVYAQQGIPINVLEGLMDERVDLLKRKYHPANHNQITDTARLLEMPLVNMHTVWDNLADEFIRNYFKGKKFETVGDIMDSVMEIPEYQEATRGKSGPVIAAGRASSRVGKLGIFFTGGTNPSKEIYMELAKAGIGTLFDMHLPEEALKELKKLHVNVINAGHIASDSIGANVFLDEIEKRGVEVVPAAGLIRVRRNKAK